MASSTATIPRRVGCYIRLILIRIIIRFTICKSYSPPTKYLNNVTIWQSPFLVHIIEIRDKSLFDMAFCWSRSPTYNTTATSITDASFILSYPDCFFISFLIIKITHTEQIPIRAMRIAITVRCLTSPCSETFGHQMVISVCSINYTFCRRNRLIIVTDTDRHFS